MSEPSAREQAAVQQAEKEAAERALEESAAEVAGAEKVAAEKEKALETVSPSEAKAASIRARKARENVEDLRAVQKAWERALNGPDGHKVKLLNARIPAQAEQWSECDLDGARARLRDALTGAAEAVGEIEGLLSEYHRLTGLRSHWIRQVANLGGSTPSKLPSLDNPLSGTGVSEAVFRSLVPGLKKLAEVVEPDENNEKETP